MHITWHLVISSVLATLAFLISGSLELALALFLGGTLIDLDHITDCILLHRKMDFNRISDNVNHTLYDEKILVSLHSLEIVILLPLLFPGIISAGIAAGMLIHMLSDFLYYRHERQKSLLSLFFIYRMSKRFSVKELCG